MDNQQYQHKEFEMEQHLKYMNQIDKLTSRWNSSS